MPSIPIDIKGLKDAMEAVGLQRDVPVYVDIVYDATADDALIDIVDGAFAATDACVEKVVLETFVPDIPTPADLCVVVGGSSVLLGDVAAAARRKGVPAVVAVAQGKTYFTDDEGRGRSFAAEAADAANRAAVRDARVPLGRHSAGVSHVVDVVEPPVAAGLPVEDVIAVDVSGRTARPLYDLGRWIAKNAPAKRVSMASQFPFLRFPLSVELTHAAAIQSGAIGVVVFVPGADMPLITLNQAKLVLQIAAAYGKPLGKERLKEVAAVVATGFGLRGIARKLTGYIPVLGFAVKGGVAYSGTLAVGYAAMDLYEGGRVTTGSLALAEKLVGKAADIASGVAGRSLSGILRPKASGPSTPV